MARLCQKIKYSNDSIFPIDSYTNLNHKPEKIWETPVARRQERQGHLTKSAKLNRGQLLKQVAKIRCPARDGG